MLALLVSMSAAPQCPQAVFFDLGDTLVEAGAGGLFVLSEGTQQTLDGLRGRGVRLGLITNVPAGFTREDLEALLEQPQLLDAFEVVVLSSQAPAPKPNPAIYLHAHGLLTAAPPITRTAFVGETLAEIANVAVNPSSGARAVGMIGIHLQAGATSPLADFGIHPLLQLLELHQQQCQLLVDGFESAGGSAFAATELELAVVAGAP